MWGFLAQYWWLMFPLAWFVGAGWNSWLNYRRQRATIELVKSYADAGKEPPAELIRALERPVQSEETGERQNWGWYQVVLFGALSVGLYDVSATSVFEDDGFNNILFVGSIVLAALALASVVAAVTFRRPKA